MHFVVGITAPKPGHNERAFVFMWLALIAFILAFCALLFYVMMNVF